MNRVSMLPCPMSSQISPSNLLEIEEALTSSLRIYRITTWIQNGTKQFLEIGMGGVTILFGLTVSANRCKFTARIHFFSSSHHPSSLTQSVTKEYKQGEGERLETRTDCVSLGKWIFCKLCFKQSGCGELTRSPEGKASFFSWNCT